MEAKEVQLDGVRSPEAQRIIDAELGKEEVGYVISEEEDDVALPSDDSEEEEEVLLAGKYKSTEELIKGIKNIGSNLPEYVLNGMSDEALEQHYKDIRKDFSKTGKDGRKHIQKNIDETKQIPETSDDVSKTTVSEELWTEIEEQFNTVGALTNEQYDKLNAQGIPDSVVDRYIDSLKIEQEAFTEKVFNIAGGQEQYVAIKEWAEENIPDTVNMLNGMKDYNQILAILKGVKADYDAANRTSQKNTLRGSVGQSNSSKGYKSESEYLNDVKDPRYRTDMRFREKVKQKLEKSSLTN